MPLLLRKRTVDVVAMTPGRERAGRLLLPVTSEIRTHSRGVLAFIAWVILGAIPILRECESGPISMHRKVQEHDAGTT